MNTHECYVSLEVAKLLKQAGFDWEIHTYYDGKYIDYTMPCRNYNSVDVYLSAPTLAVAQKWLREVKDIKIDVVSSYFVNGYYVEWTVKDTTTSLLVDQNYEFSERMEFEIYEDALEAGINKCLTLILEKDANH